MGVNVVGRTLVLAFGLISILLLLEPPPRPDTTVRLSVLPNPQIIRVIGRSQLEFVADLFWVRMANMAGRAQTSSEYAALLPIGNFIADLSPKFKYPYLLGGALAPVRRFPSHDYDNAKEAVELMARGTRDVPTFARLYVQKAYSEMEMLHDSLSAGRTFMQASRVAGAPAFCGALATRLLSENGQFQDASQLAVELAQSDDPEVRADFQHRLLQIKLEELLVQIDAGIDAFQQREGRRPASVKELVDAHDLPGFPMDPFGGEIIITPDGARSTVEMSRLKAYIPLE
jgi:hypothetical protein